MHRKKKKNGSNGPVDAATQKWDHPCSDLLWGVHLKEDTFGKCFVHPVH